MSTKNTFFSSLFFALLSTAGTGTFTSFFKDNKLLKSHNTVEIKVFLDFFYLLMEESESGSVQIIRYRSGSGTL